MANRYSQWDPQFPEQNVPVKKNKSYESLMWAIENISALLPLMDHVSSSNKLGKQS